LVQPKDDFLSGGYLHSNIPNTKSLPLAQSLGGARELDVDTADGVSSQSRLVPGLRDSLLEPLDTSLEFFELERRLSIGGHRSLKKQDLSMVHILISSFFQTSYFFLAHISGFVS
jgi:hypothetical protein